MRADYATSDLINKVNSDWINQVLANPEIGADPGDDETVSDLMLRGDSAREQTIPWWQETVAPPANSASVAKPSLAIGPIARSSRRRTVARRVAERLTLAVAALAVVWVGARMAPEPRAMTNSAPVHATSAAPEQAAPIITTELRPAWLVPEILYGPAMARSPISGLKTGR